MTTISTGDTVQFGIGYTQEGVVESVRTKRIRGVQTKQVSVRCADGSLHMALCVRKVER